MSATSINKKSWWLSHCLWPAVAGLAILALLTWFDTDIWLSGLLFRLEGGVHAWPLRYWWFTDKFMHTGGRDLVLLAAVVLLIGLLASQFHPRIKVYRRGLVYLFCSVAVSVLLVRYGKSVTQVYCPWDLTQFGGSHSYVPFPMSLWQSDSGGQCFPGGHSSGAFAWVALYYFAAVYWPKWRWPLLAGVVCIGALFGLDQELRGAHFLSHDLTSLLISWLVASLMYALFWPRESVARRIRGLCLKKTA